MAPAHRWVCVMVAVFSFSENNFDNFPIITLLVFFMLGARAVKATLPTPAPAAVRVRRGRPIAPRLRLQQVPVSER
jgi:hypothetical protein